MSPARSRTATLAWYRTATASSLVAIGCLRSLSGGAVTAQVHDEVDRVVRAVAGGAQLVDHVADQEQAPAAGGLPAGDLGVQVGLGGVGDRPGADCRARRRS